MKFFLPIVCLLCISRDIFCDSMKNDLAPYADDLSYEDILNFNASCFPRDSCLQSRTKEEDDFEIFTENTCYCNSRCWEFGACCIDSPYRGKTPIQKCIDTGNEFVFFNPFKMIGNYMVYRCPDSTYSDSVWKNLCEKEWSGEDDILMISPVTSLETNLTYKNYYCFRCHETTDKYKSWDILIQSIYNISEVKNDYSLTYSQAEKTWMVSVDNNRISIPVGVRFEYRTSWGFIPTACNPRLIADCSDTWTDKSVRDKCLAYTAVIYGESFLSEEFIYGSYSYKNVHCALCNYVPLDTLTCKRVVSFATRPSPDKKIFSFRHLLNLNIDEVKVENGEKCRNDHLWDPYNKKCRKISCVNPEYVIKGNKCVPP